MRFSVFVVAIGLLVSACFQSPYLVSRYPVSADNVEALRPLESQPVGVGNFTATRKGQNEVGCRGGSIEVSDHEDFSGYLRQALVDELKLARAYSASSSVTLTGNLDELDVSSNRGLWKLRLTVHSSNGRALSVEEQYSYRTSFGGERACTLAAQNFTSAVQNLLGKLVRSPEFPSLVSAESGALPKS